MWKYLINRMKPSNGYAFLVVCILVVAAFGTLQTYSLQQTQSDLQNQIAGLNYQVSTLQSQLLNATGWSRNSGISLLVTGLVQHPLNLTFYDLITMPWTTVNATMYCIGPPTGVIAGGNWTGVSLASILQRANASTTAIKVAFYATDNYSTDLTLATGMQNNIVVAFENNGVPLTQGLRLVTPGLWGYKWIYQLSDINLVDYNFLGTMESMGYSDSGLVA